MGLIFNHKDITIIKRRNKMNYWEPKMEEVYWYIDNDSLPYSAIWVKGYIDVWRFNIGNIFRTQEEAILKLDYLKVKNELKNTLVSLSMVRKIILCFIVINIVKL